MTSTSAQVSQLSEVQLPPFFIYHWAPVSRRASIQKNGLVPGKKSRDGSFRPDYICYSDSPSMAWAYSAAFSDVEEEWDLWMTRGHNCSDLHIRDDMVGGRPAEWRSRQRVPKRKLWWVGSRWRTPKGRREGRPATMPVNSVHPDWITARPGEFQLGVCGGGLAFCRVTRVGNKKCMLVLDEPGQNPIGLTLACEKWAKLTGQQWLSDKVYKL